jgi:hypothetical protein
MRHGFFVTCPKHVDVTKRDSSQLVNSKLTVLKAVHPVEDDMKTTIVIAATVFGLACAPATAQTVSNTSLQPINGAYGAGFATTTTTASGTRTTVVGLGGGANRASGTAMTGQWYQANVGAGGTVGITTDYARSGNGSAYFSTTNVDSKADLQYSYGTLIPLSSLSSVSFDFYRDGASTTTGTFAPVLRFDIAKNGAFAGSLVFEDFYQGQTNPPTDVWTTLTASLNSGIFWATNAALGPTFAAADGGQKTLAQWISANEGSTLSVYGMSIGVGSGWTGTFAGAVDNVNVNFAGRSPNNFNFEVAAAAVPEPSTWLTMLLGFGMIGLMLRAFKKSDERFTTKMKTIAIS